MELLNTSKSRHPMRSVRAPVDERGVALLIALAVLVLMALLAVSFYRSQDIESRAASTGAHARRTESIAEGGSQWAIALLMMDTENQGDLCTLAYDTNFDIWAPKAHDSGKSYANDSALLFYGTDVDPFDPIGNGTPVCGWKIVRDGLRVTGRFIVYIEDENGKVNLDLAGNEKHTRAEGLSPAELDLGTILTAIDSSWGNSEADAIITVRFGQDKKPGTGGTDDDGDLPIGFPGCDDNLDGMIDNAGEALDEPDEYNYGVPYGDDIRLLDFTTAIMDTSIGDLKSNGNATDAERYRKLRAMATVGSWSQCVYKLHPSTDDNTDEWKFQVDVNHAVASQIRDTLQMLQDAGRLPTNGPSGEPLDLDQIAVNMADFLDDDNEPTEFNGKYGIERTAYINEVEASPAPVPWGAGQMIEWGEYIELINPYDEKIEVTLVNVPQLIGPGANITVSVPAARGNTPGFAVIADTSGTEVFTDPNTGQVTQIPHNDLAAKAGPRGGKFAASVDLDLKGSGKLTLALGGGSTPVIEVCEYPDFGVDTNTTAQKDDPRASTADNWKDDNGTPGAENANWDPGASGDKDAGAELSQLFIVYNGPVGSVGHLGHVHIGEPWATIDLTGDDVTDWETLPESESWLNIYDAFTTDASAAAGLGRYGLININTAPEEVLSGLKGVDAHAVFTDTEKGVMFRSIGQMANPAYLSPAGTATSWEREKALADIANLITVQSSTFRVTVVAQAVARSGEASRVAERRLEAIVRRYINPADGTAYVKVISSRWLTED